MIKIVSTFILASLLATTAMAQDMPAPRRMPRTPVSRETIVVQHDPVPTSHELQGPAAIIDGEKMRIGDTDLRLFGIVPPQLAASFGPQARAQLDTLANGQNVSCKIRDRDRDARLLATCRNASGNDMALELLKRGLAVTARGSIAGTELAVTYSAAEQAAQTQKLGLWSVATSAPAVVAPPAPAAVTPALQPVKVESPAAATPVEAEAKKEDKTAAHVETPTQAKIAADLLSQQTQARIDDTFVTTDQEEGFFERYQILIAGLLMLTTALSIIGALWAHKIRDRRDETKALAAALRGELMAARGVCAGRAKNIVGEAEDRLAVWPRIRTTLYQAYVGRLGLLGAELARQVASVYGQSSDYSTLYNPAATTGATHDVPKKQALEVLVKRIDEVLPKLAEIEKTGVIPAPVPVYTPRPHSEAPVAVADPAPVATTEPDTTTEEAPVAVAVTVINTPPAPAVMTPQHHIAVRTTLSLWESVRYFIQTHRDTIIPPPPPLPPLPVDPHVAEYAALIEEDMARYQYSDNIEPLDLIPQKKRG